MDKSQRMEILQKLKKAMSRPTDILSEENNNGANNSRAAPKGTREKPKNSKPKEGLWNKWKPSIFTIAM